MNDSNKEEEKLLDKKTVEKGYGIYALVMTIPVVLIMSILFSFEGDISCTAVAKEEPVCTQRFVWNGWKAVPLQAIGGAVGTAIAVYTARGSWAELLGKLVTQNTDE